MTITADVLDGLNADQRAAATQQGSPLLILAGAGTGQEALAAQVRRLGLEAAVSLPGRVSEQAKSDLLSQAWLTVAAGFLACFTLFGVAYSFGAFFKPMAQEFGLGVTPWSPLAPGRSMPIMNVCSLVWTGVQRNWTLRKNTMPVGPQYSSEFGNTSMSMNGLIVWPAPHAPSSPQA